MESRLIVTVRPSGFEVSLLLKITVEDPSLMVFHPHTSGLLLQIPALKSKNSATYLTSLKSHQPENENITTTFPFPHPDEISAVIDGLTY